MLFNSIGESCFEEGAAGGTLLLTGVNGSLKEGACITPPVTLGVVREESPGGGGRTAGALNCISRSAVEVTIMD